MNCFKSEYDETYKGMVINGYTCSPAEVVSPDTLEGEPVVKIGKGRYLLSKKVRHTIMRNGNVYMGDQEEYETYGEG